MPRTTKKDVATSQTLARGLLILDSFSEERASWGVRELSRELGINTTTTHRLLATLHQAGYLDQDPVTQQYRLGPQVTRLSNLYVHHYPLPQIAREVFQAYSKRFKYSFFLGTLRGTQVITLAVHEGIGPVRVAIQPGGAEDIHSTSMGKVLTAFRHADDLREFVHSLNLTRKTKRTIVDPEVLIKELEKVREKGYAFNRGENYPELNAVGAPVYDQYRQVVAATSLAYPRDFVDESRVPAFVKLILEVAAEISYRYGGVQGAIRK